ncbi:MAG: hypothetical protein K2K68_05650, partial [Duncaniella sp.]|nr:hypothetical protein [Duncaniella sp.]
MKLSRYISFLFAIPALIFTACEDELPYDDYVIGEGDASLSAEVEFHPLDPALDSRAAGNAVNTINELWMVIYKFNADGTEAGLYEKVKIYDSAENDYILPGSNFQIDQTGNTGVPGDAASVTPPSDTNVGPNDGAVGGTGEATPRASFKLPNIPYGRYKMFAVANVDLTDVDCTTIDNLRKTRFKWNTDVRLDNQMFGYFTPYSSQTSNAEAPLITLNEPEVKLHAWVKRLVSKVTVSFDPSDLNENVRIYIKSVTIHDIPEYCYLGEKNTPTDTLQLIRNGESFTYYNPGEDSNADHEKWKIILSKRSGSKGETGHTEADRALYFFENMQGNYEGQSQYDKRQNPDEVGKLVDYPSDGPDYKDAKLCGTYIEVEAYYDSRHKDKISQGPIKYRFMLGKNSTFNYDAERNYHYKLTLKFRGWANEVDWHIHYKEYTRTLITPEPYYISYLYGQEMDFPARVLLLPEDNPADFSVKAEIVENNWWPWDREHKNADGTKGARPAEFVPSGLTGLRNINGFAWNVGAFNNNFPYVPYSPAKYTTSFPYGGSNYVGFLSLKPNTVDVIGTDADILASGLSLDKNGYGTNANTYLKNYYQNNKLAENQYSLVGPQADFDNIDKSVNVLIPMYTRNKEMVPATDFTGNNVFNAYHRFAKVRFTLWKGNTQIPFKNEKGEDETERISTIYQVPRIENPKAIYRDANNDQEFDIQLMVLPNAGTSTYATFPSDGPWRASIMCQTESFIELMDSTGSGKIDALGQYIHGSTDMAVHFKYKPKGKITDDKTRCGIIKVEYHDYNCVHLIFVRQGYHQGVELGNATWSCYNVYATSRGGANRDSYVPGQETSVQVALTRSPLSVGSYLKRSQYNYSIREANNDTYGWLQSVTGESLSTAYIDASGNTQTRDAKWGDIQGFGWTNFEKSNGTTQTLAQRATNRKWADTWTAVQFQAGQRFDVPTAENYKSLITNCKFGYGIVYADGANSTASDFATANGYTDYGNTGSWSEKGVRACVVYNETDGKNIIFPLSALGQARRACSAPYGTTSWGTVPFTDPGVGSITYGGMRMVLG